MALTKEIWINSIIEGLFADNTFASRSLNHSGFVNAKTVHVPNAGALPGVVKNRSELPGTVGGRNDIDLTYNIAEYTTNPLIIRDAEKVELVYDKRESLVGGTRTALAEAVHADLLRSWVPSGFAHVATTGATEKGHLAGTTSADLKAVTKADILALKKQFDKDGVPQTGRCILLDAVMYNQLLDALSEAEAERSSQVSTRRRALWAASTASTSTCALRCSAPLRQARRWLLRTLPQRPTALPASHGRRDASAARWARLRSSRRTTALHTTATSSPLSCAQEALMCATTRRAWLSSTRALESNGENDKKASHGISAAAERTMGLLRRHGVHRQSHGVPLRGASIEKGH